MRRRPTVAIVLVVAVGVVVLGCSTPAPTATNVVPPPEEPTAPLVFLALGGDEAVAPEPPPSAPGAGVTTTTSPAEAFTASWVHRAFGRLPSQTTHVDLSAEGATAEDTLTEQLPRAVGTDPTVTTVWLGPGDERAGTGPADFRRRLDDIVGTLEYAGVPRIVLLTRPDGTPDGRFAAEVAAAAEGHERVRVVVLPRKPALRPDPADPTTTTTADPTADPVGSATAPGTSTTTGPPAVDDREAVAAAVVAALG